MDKFISDINDKEIAGMFYEKESEKANQEQFTAEKVIKKKDMLNIYVIRYVINDMLNRKTIIIILIVRLIKKTQYK